MESASLVADVLRNGKSEGSASRHAVIDNANCASNEGCVTQITWEGLD